MARLHPVVCALLEGLRRSPLDWLASEAEAQILARDERLRGLRRDRRRPTRQEGFAQLEIVYKTVRARIDGETAMRLRIMEILPELRLKDAVVLYEEAPPDRLTDQATLTSLAGFLESFEGVMRSARQALELDDGARA